MLFTVIYSVLFFYLIHYSRIVCLKEQHDSYNLSIFLCVPFRRALIYWSACVCVCVCVNNACCVWLRSFCGSCLSGAGVCRLIPAGAAESSLPGNWCLTSVTRSLPSRWQQAPAWALPACAATLCACHVTFCAYLCPSDNERVKVCVNLEEGFACVLKGYHVLHRSDDIWSSVVCWD